ncbi:MAG: right-handed parallel beta-helix repeat-containing protein [Planctomycetota bacterium]|nr:right-handed parallel beta-helix repeat-containing protein [Planctomycetota bacterium]
MNRFAQFLAAVLAVASQGLPAAEFYVATAGNDANPGTKTQPFATLERVRDEIRKLKQTGPLAQPVAVLVHGGTYRIGTSLVLGSQDSGTEASPIVWQAAAGEEVRLCGGVALPADAFQPVTDERISARLDPAARGKVVQADLRSIGVKELGSYPDSFRGAPTVPELFFNDQRMTPARWPNEGWATIAKIVEAGSVPRDGDTSPRPGTFEYSGDRPTRWNVEAGVWLLGYWCFDWYEETIKVQSIDGDKRQITLARPTVYGIKQGNPAPRRYRALNLLEELDQPGEFYVDRVSGRLYFWPPAEMTGVRIVLSTLNGPVVSLKDAAHVTLRGFIVEASLGDGIEVSGGRNNRIETCHVRNIRQLGVRITGGLAHRIKDCDIHDTGTGGLVLEGGDRKTLTAAGHEAVNNRIWRFSQHQLTYASGITLGGVGNRAAHNLLHDAPHMAVGINGNDHVFEYNLVRDVCTASDDAAALYKGRNPSCRGNVIRYNFWRDIGSPMGHGTAAVYFDDGDGGDTVFGNVFFRCGHPGRGSFGTVFSHGGHDNTAENNIFIECQRALGSAPWDDKRWKEAVDGGQGCEWQTRLLKEVDITQPPYTTRYPDLAGFMTPQPGQVRVNHAKNNVLVRCEQVHSGNWKYAPDEIWATDGDPSFIDAVNGNFLLRPDAEVFKRLPGFKPIPFDKIGPEPRTASISR